MAHEPPIRVMALHALLYCKRLFYLEEVEEIRVADAAVYAGRELHTSLEGQDGGEWCSVEIESERLGLSGKIDCLRRRDGTIIPYEHKRGRCHRVDGVAEVWPSDRVQAAAYAMMLADSTGQDIPEARVHYHAENVTVRVPIDDKTCQEVIDAVSEARRLRSSVERPPITDNERLCVRCYEGKAAVHYFGSLNALLGPEVPGELHYRARTRRPPRDRFNALLSFGYGLLHSAVMRAVLAVGLEPAFGFYHQPRSAAHPLVLDLMELFRVPLWDLVVIGSLNRGQWRVDQDFSATPSKVWLSAEGRRKAISLFEKRLEERWKHPVLDYSLSYARTLELEVRLLEKEWTGEPGLFARSRLR